jgi:hypothetical protein
MGTKSVSDIDVRKLIGYGSQLHSLFVDGYFPLEVYDFFPKGYTNQMNGREFLQFLRREGLKVKVVKREHHPSPGLNEHEAIYTVEGHEVRVHSSKYFNEGNFVAIPPRMPKRLLTRIGKAVSKGLAQDWIKTMQEYVDGPSRNCCVGTDPSKEVELYSSFVEKVDTVRDFKELRRLVKETAKANKKIEVPWKEWDKRKASVASA